MQQQRIYLASIGILAIAIGLAGYAFLRPVRVALIPSALHFAASEPHPQAFFGALPSVIHAFAMPLLTVACLHDLRRRQIAIACGLWWAVDVVLELGQRTEIGFLPRGTFDPLDLAAVTLGAALAGGFAFAQLRSKA